MYGVCNTGGGPAGMTTAAPHGTGTGDGAGPAGCRRGRSVDAGAPAAEVGYRGRLGRGFDRRFGRSVVDDVGLLQVDVPAAISVAAGLGAAEPAWPGLAGALDVGAPAARFGNSDGLGRGCSWLRRSVIDDVGALDPGAPAVRVGDRDLLGRGFSRLHLRGLDGVHEKAELILRAAAQDKKQRRQKWQPSGHGLRGQPISAANAPIWRPIG